MVAIKEIATFFIFNKRYSNYFYIIFSKKFFKHRLICDIILIGIGVHKYLLFYYTGVKEAKYANTGIEITKFSEL